jgi:hypothetical protein
MARLNDLLYCFLYLFTWPYYATFVRYTLEPLKRIAGPQNDLVELSQCVQDFALGKAAELKYIGFAVSFYFRCSLDLVRFMSIYCENSRCFVYSLLTTFKGNHQCRSHSRYILLASTRWRTMGRPCAAVCIPLLHDRRSCHWLAAHYVLPQNVPLQDRGYRR